MAVYFDEIVEYPLDRIKPAARRFGTRWCHLWASDEEELHIFACSIGLARSSFQGDYARPEFYHYDLTPGMRNRAHAAGAIFKPSRQHADEIAAAIIARSKSEESDGA